MIQRAIVFLVTLIGITTSLQAQSNSEIPDEIKEVIYSKVMDDILRYRLWINPEFTTEDRMKTLNPAEYNTYNDKIFRRPLTDGEKLVLEIKRWPEDDPRMNYYLVKKKSNLFIRWRNDKNKALGRDTILVEEYEKFNKYFQHDNNFLIFYDGKDYKRVSGNIIQDWFSNEWFVNKTPTQAAWFRMAQYNAKHPYKINETDKDWLIFFEKCDLIKNDPGAFIIQMGKKWYYTSFSIVYYSNKKELTGDDDKHNFYEIRYHRDYSKHEWPIQFSDTIPVIRKLSQDEIKNLNEFYKDVIYKFGDIDYSVFE